MVSIFDLRDDLATYLSTVRDEHITLVVRRFGKPIALISPYMVDIAPKVDDYFGFLPKTGGRGSAFLSRHRRSAKEKKRTTALRS